MSKPIYHAESSARRHGGKMEDYLEIHNFMDCSKGAMPDNRHRALTHNSWFISNVIERVFGFYVVNSNGKKVSTRQIAEEHVLEDFGGQFIPTAQDYIENMEIMPWMNSGMAGKPNSTKKLKGNIKGVTLPLKNVQIVD
jgi:hypothetical protein